MPVKQSGSKALGWHSESYEERGRGGGGGGGLGSITGHAVWEMILRSNKGSSASGNRALPTVSEQVLNLQ